MSQVTLVKTSDLGIGLWVSIPNTQRYARVRKATQDPNQPNWYTVTFVEDESPIRAHKLSLWRAEPPAYS